MKEKLVTIFTPTYNRKHTIGRTYESLLRQTCKDFNWLIIDDGSTDGTREWVLSLGNLVKSTGTAYDWMGRPSCQITSDHFFVDANGLLIEYIAKENGGLYTGYNVAYDAINTELCVCIDSDDYMPDDAVETIKQTWNNIPEKERNEIAGIVGLDYNVVDLQPIGGLFPINECLGWNVELHHRGDEKYVIQTRLMKRVIPQIGFKNERDFNPHYMQMQILDQYKVFVINKNLCWVEYQIGADSMSQAIFKQYRRSPKSYAKYRLMELNMTKGVGFLKRISLHAHYISSCIFSSDRNWLKNSPSKLWTILTLPLGIAYNLLIRIKTISEK